MGVKLVSASAGSVEIVPPTTASNFTATLPAGTGTMVVNGVNSSIVSGTVQPSTTGTFIDFTSIPSWVKRITVMFNDVSTNGSNLIIVQLGPGSVTTSGYISSGSTNGATSANITTGFIVNGRGSANAARIGSIVITNITSNTWVMFGSTNSNDATAGSYDVWSVAGSIALAGALDRIRITTVNGTDTFDAGSINILYE